MGGIRTGSVHPSARLFAAMVRSVRVLCCRGWVRSIQAGGFEPTAPATLTPDHPYCHYRAPKKNGTPGPAPLLCARARARAGRLCGLSWVRGIQGRISLPSVQAGHAASDSEWGAGHPLRTGLLFFYFH